jgi:hypothetical protein
MAMIASKGVLAHRRSDRLCQRRKPEETLRRYHCHWRPHQGRYSKTSPFQALFFRENSEQPKDDRNARIKLDTHESGPALPTPQARRNPSTLSLPLASSSRALLCTLNTLALMPWTEELAWSWEAA